MLGRLSGLLLLCLAMQALFACSEKDRQKRTPIDTWEGVCIDQDGDGRGFQCEQGDDCDDDDPSIFQGCALCAKPNEGCECEQGSEPLDCMVDPELTREGALLCKSGTRYCRDGAWTACEGLVSKAIPAPKAGNVKLQSLVSPDAGAKRCTNPCAPDCYTVDDELGTYDGGTDSGTVAVPAADGGGITVPTVEVTSDASYYDGNYLNNYDCIPGTAPDVDCDGVEDVWDTNNSAPPFETDNTALFMDLAPGQKASQALNVNFKLKSADIYFLLDMTASMEDERDNLVNTLTSGDYITDPVTCSDRNYDGVADAYLEQQGVAGNIACLIRDARFGAGLFRDLPFSGYGAKSFTMFEHRLDITSDVDALSSSLAALDTVGGQDYPEGGMQAMWPLLTGGEVYAGWDRPGTPRRLCPTGTWGWPCFRNGAIPIIVHVTDDEMHEGPPTSVNGASNYLPYASGNIDTLSRGSLVSGSNYLGVFGTGEAESFDTAVDIGNVTGKYYTYAGNTEKMTSDVNFAMTGSCPNYQSAWLDNDQSSPDAVFKFSVTGTKTIQFSTNGSRFDTSVLLMSGGVLPTSTNITASNNGTYATAQALGALGAGQRFVISGNTSTHPAVYGRESLSTGTSGCYYSNSGDSLEPASVMKFQVASAMKVRVTSSAPNAVETALLRAAKEPTSIDLNTIDCGSGTSANCNDTAGSYSIGNLTGQHFYLHNGSTQSATSDYTSLTCPSGSYSSGRDVAVDFSLASPTSIRIEAGPKGTDRLSDGTGFNYGMFLFKKSAAGATTVKAVSSSVGDTQQSPVEINASTDVPSNGDWVSYRGDSNTYAANYAQSEVGGDTANVCHNNNVGAASPEKDIVFKLNVTGGPTAFEFDTATPTVGQGYKTWLSLHKGTIGRVTTTASSNASEQDTNNGGQLVINPVDGKRGVITGAQMHLRDRSYQASAASWWSDPNDILLGNNCGAQGNSNGRDAVFRFTTTAAGQVKLSTVSSAGSAGTAPAFRTFMAVFKGSITASNRKTGNCPSPGWFGTPTDSRQSGNAWTDTISVDANSTYYVVVKEWTYNAGLNATSGAYGLLIEDVNYAGSFQGCDAGSSIVDSKFSRLTATLANGTYYLVLKGTGVAPNTSFALNVRRAAATLGAQQACVNSAQTRASLEAPNLAAGDYTLVLKGGGNWSNSGGYSLTLRDLAVAPAPMDCANTANAATFTSAATLSPGIDYYLVTRANTSSGPYQVILEDSNVAVPLTATSCDNDGGEYNNAKRSVSLAQGSYYAIVKGRKSTDKGWFQLSIGETSAISNNQNFAPKKYLGGGGVKENIASTKARVITVYSGLTSIGGDEQSQVMSKHSLATEDGTVSGTALSYNIPSNGSGLGANVVKAVSKLVNVLKMNVTVVLSPSPQSPPPGKPFLFDVEALGKTSNCEPTTLDTDGNGKKDTYQKCGPGAAPDWKVTFENPLNNPVPENPDDPNGGYHMTLQLIGDKDVPTGYPGALVDEIPVYIIPKDVVKEPVVTQYAATGTYEQVVTSACSGTDAPVWRFLDWSASLPAGTSIEYKMCGGNTDSEVASCSLQSVGTVTSTGVACTTANQAATCGASSFCNAAGVCETMRTSLTCDPGQSGVDCGEAGVCTNAAGVNKCQFTARPIDIAKTISANQGRKKMRVQIIMNSSSDRKAAPVVNKWNLDYFCAPGV